jgi:hypothetical protein
LLLLATVGGAAGLIASAAADPSPLQSSNFLTKAWNYVWSSSSSHGAVLPGASLEEMSRGTYAKADAVLTICTAVDARMSHMQTTMDARMSDMQTTIGVLTQTVGDLAMNKSREIAAARAEVDTAWANYKKTLADAVAESVKRDKDSRVEQWNVYNSQLTAFTVVSWLADPTPSGYTTIRERTTLLCRCFPIFVTAARTAFLHMVSMEFMTRLAVFPAAFVLAGSLAFLCGLALIPGIGVSIGVAIVAAIPEIGQFFAEMKWTFAVGHVVASFDLAAGMFSLIAIWLSLSGYRRIGALAPAAIAVNPEQQNSTTTTDDDAMLLQQIEGQTSAAAFRLRLAAHTRG